MTREMVSKYRSEQFNCARYSLGDGRGERRKWNNMFVLLIISNYYMFTVYLALLV